MDLKKLRIFVVLFLLLLQLHPFDSALGQPTSQTKSTEKIEVSNQKERGVHNEKMMPRKESNGTRSVDKKMVVVDRRGGGGGGHAGGGHVGGGHAGGGGRGSNGWRGPTIIPLYAAGAMPHRQNSHHHGSNKATLSCACPNFSLLLALAFLVFQY